MNTIYLCNNSDNIRRVYAASQHARLHALTGLSETVYTKEMLLKTPMPGIEAVFSTWGMPQMTGEEIARCLPDLKAVYYGAGTVQAFARPFLTRGVRVFSAWQANAVPVVRYTVAQILLALKGYFRVQPVCRDSREQARALFAQYPGSYDVKVGLLGCGAIGRRVAQMLCGMDMEILVYDPFLSDEQAGALGVKKTSMEEIFRSCMVVSNHLANLPATVGIIRRDLLLSMQPYSTFINTGRGAQLREEDLFDMLTQDPTRTAILDVLEDESQSNDKPLNRLENCLITPHIAGSSGFEVRRMADYMISAFELVQAGKTCDYEVSMAMLDTMA